MGVPHELIAAVGVRAIIFAGVGLSLAMVASLEAGRRLGVRRRVKNPDGSVPGLGAIEGAVFGLLGLLIAFTCSGAAARFDLRRQLIGQEANAIGTAYLRISLLPPTNQIRLRDLFRNYLDTRIAYYQNIGNNPGDAARKLGDLSALQNEIWKQGVEATRNLSGNPSAAAITSLFVQSLNDMIDITTTRWVAMQTHPPGVVFGMLIALVLVCSVLAGYGTGSNRARCWLHVTGFVIILTLTVLIILDYEYPRFGLIRIDPLDQLLVALRQGIR